MPSSFLEPDLAPHFNAWKASPSPETADRLLGATKPIIEEALRTYGGASAESPNLRSRAKQLFLDAAQRYDPTRAKLRTHALTQLQGLRRFAAREEQIVRMPEQLLLDRRRMSQSENELRDRMGRDPSDTEIADHAGLSLRRIGKIRSMPSAYAEGTLTHVTGEGAGVMEPAVVNAPSDKARETWLQIVHSDLGPVDQLILEHSVGLHGKAVLSNQDIAHKLKISPGAVSQRRLRIQQKLDAAPLTGLFG